MNIRRATVNDIDGIMKLLSQVLTIHHNGRPDIFKANATKYTVEELSDIIKDENRPILVAVENEQVLGYAFCIYQQNKNNNILTDIKTLYIDDLCVDENIRGKHIGTALYDAVLTLAKETECYNVTLNVWCLNESAMEFYKSRKMKPLKIAMEQIIE